ncbi:Methionyl-tRNA formyltransferase [Stieleria neptunia]|uniref:Methionyl-tRNA formyltransferase n=1 Tax=Stieleria neptunia TaxID=2527979 RepID=A0A518HUZ0_9BACT|nr:methionyl-tRNA formyltransferase [Stieleria neptunia]QDV44681.1 Methionyl-tRNA formyltransferase [Stieleria neptunia]
MGTGPFAVPSFEAIRRSGHTLLAVVTKPEPPVKSRKGPPPAPVRTWAAQHGLSILDPASINDVEAIGQLKALQPDLLVVCDYGQILKPDALAVSNLGGINLHGSLLPAYRGAAPVQRALLNGDRETGVSVIHMTPKLDGGPILGTRRTTIADDETSGQLEQRLSQLGVDLVLQSIDELERWDGESPIGEVQDTERATKAPRLSKREAQVDWQRSCREIDCLVRGMQPWPVAFSMIKVRENKPPLRLTILKVTPVEQPTDDLQPGQITGGKELVVMAGDGALRIDTLCPAGKREMTGEEFQRGYQLARGTQFL